MNKIGIIFDLDGTLWNAEDQIVPAWNSIFNKYPELNMELTNEDLGKYMGKTLEEIAGIMFPNMELDCSMELLDECCDEEHVYLSKHGGILYPNLEETLTLLQKDYDLYIVSNCQDGYIQLFLEYHQLNDYFKDYEMAGRTGKNKGENIKDIMDRNKITQAVYIGDTIGDLEGAKYAEIPFVYASYGFGEVDHTLHTINDLSELPSIMEKVFNV